MLILRHWPRILGIGMIAVGAWATLSGFRHLQEAGIDLGPHATYRYAMSKQWAGITGGVMFVVLGVMVYRLERD